MNKKRLTTILLSALLSVSCLFTACGEDNMTEKPKTPTSVTSFKVDNSQNHIDNSTATDKKIIENSVTEYKLVIPAAADAVLEEAAKELTVFTMKSNGMTFETIKDSECVSGGKYISLGKTTLLEECGLEVDYAKLGTDGYQIKTVEDTVYVIGENYGVLYGAYGLLGDWFDYEYFYKDCYTLNGATTVLLKNYDITEIPDIAYRAGGYGTMWEETQTINRYRMRIYSNFFVSIRGAIFHNAFKFLPVADHLETHPYWYSTGGDQTCYTARGDADEFQAMVDETVRVLKEELIAQPEKNLVTFSILDNNNACNCEACNDIVDTYGSEAAGIVLFLNEVNADIKEWFASEGEEYARDLKICFFAYNKYEKPPVKFNVATGKYEGVNGLRCDDGVCALIAPLNASYTSAVDDPQNEALKFSLDGWNAISGDIATWFYDTLYGSMENNYTFYNTFDGYQERYRYAYKVGSFWMFNEGQDQIYGSQMGFNNLKMYISDQLAWNVNADYQAMIDRYFKAMFGTAQEPLRKLFNELRARSIYNEEIYSAGSDCYATLSLAKYWPKESLLRWHGYIEEALKAIEPVKDINLEQYESYYMHIVSERLAINFALFTYYEGSLSNEQIEQFKSEYRSDVATTGITRASGAY